jgi:small conductance mechanosensitive channel
MVLELNKIQILNFVIKIAIAGIVFLIGRWLARRVDKMLDKNLSASKITPTMARLLNLAVYYGIMWLVLIISLAVVGVPLQSLLTASLIIVAVGGFVLKESLSNLAATILFMVFEPFRVGELIEANGIMGTVKELQLVSTSLVTYDNKEITIPNSEIQSNNLINYSRRGTLLAVFNFKVSYADDIAKVKAVLQEIMDAEARVLPEPPPLIFVKSLDDNCVSISMRVMVKSEDYYPILSSIPERVKLRFDAEGITFPNPQRDVHLYGHDAAGLRNKN